MTRAPKAETFGPVTDVWDVATFPADVLDLLVRRSTAVEDYFAKEHELTVGHDLSPSADRPLFRPDNTHAHAYRELVEAIADQMGSREIRAFHYTRMTDDEVRGVRRSGIEPSTPQSFRRRLDALVTAAVLEADTADRLFESSPFHSKHDARAGMFWMTSHPLASDDFGVRELLRRWGGEVASFGLPDDGPTMSLASIGRPRVLELAVPVDATSHEHATGTAMVATIGRSIGCIPEKSHFDLYVRTALAAEAVLAVNTEGDKTFAAIGRGYPLGFVDVSLGRWQELTGEDD